MLLLLPLVGSTPLCWSHYHHMKNMIATWWQLHLELHGAPGRGHGHGKSRSQHVRQPFATLAHVFATLVPTTPSPTLTSDVADL